MDRRTTASNPPRPEGAVAVVTGAGQGIGAAVARVLLDGGWRVAALDLDGAGLADLKGPGVVTRVGDASDGDTLAALIDDATALGPVVAGVANAGIFLDDRVPKLDDDRWGRVLDVDLTGPFRLLRALWPQMVDHGFGRFVAMSSVAKDGNFGQANYAAAKAGLVGLAKTAAIEGGRSGITANVLCPGVIETPANASFREAAPAAYEKFLSRVPARRAGSAADVANVCGFLLSESAGYVSGQVLYVDGGLSCGHT
ncbi:MAG TPA: SDR family NAD(P)-dependent oxidoreductase [Acidimicrobiales bacterium]|nr:SDR family NAD(P)-dependent oxidoreductase [Acidimicrobiales bacterium]